MGIDKTGCSLVVLGCNLLQVRGLISEQCRSIDFQTTLLVCCCHCSYLDSNLRLTTQVEWKICITAYRKKKNHSHGLNPESMCACLRAHVILFSAGLSIFSTLNVLHKCCQIKMSALFSSRAERPSTKPSKNSIPKTKRKRIGKRASLILSYFISICNFFQVNICQQLCFPFWKYFWVFLASLLVLKAKFWCSPLH